MSDREQTPTTGRARLAFGIWACVVGTIPSVGVAIEAIVFGITPFAIAFSSSSPASMPVVPMIPVAIAMLVGGTLAVLGSIPVLRELEDPSGKTYDFHAMLLGWGVWNLRVRDAAALRRTLWRSIVGCGVVMVASLGFALVLWWADRSAGDALGGGQLPSPPDRWLMAAWMAGIPAGSALWSAMAMWLTRGHGEVSD